MLASKTIIELNAIVGKYKQIIPAPEAGVWEKKSDGELWLSVLVQIAVVGKEAPGKAVIDFLANDVNGWYARLLSMKPERRLKSIHDLLRKCGVRYVAQDIAKCKKSVAANYNFELLASCGGPRSYFQKIAEVDHEGWRIAAVADDLAYVKNKGARDLLIGLGLLQNAIAFDVRIKNILEHLGAILPNDIAVNRSKYKALESELLETICKPNEITGGHFDRILFSSYKEILA